MGIIKKEITGHPTPEQLKEGYMEWTPENDKKMRERRAAEEKFVINDGEGYSPVKLQKKLEPEDIVSDCGGIEPSSYITSPVE